MNSEDTDKIIRDAVLGSMQAQFELGNLYRDGIGVEKDYRRAVIWHTKAANQGHAHSQYNLGLRYHNGQGVAKDYKKSVLYFAKAADQGHIKALYNLGFRYYNGQGVAKNHHVAMEIFGKVAETGEAYAQYNFASKLFEMGNYDSAAIWYIKAAEQDYLLAQKKLVEMYFNNKGVPRDVDKAGYWHKKAQVTEINQRNKREQK